MCVSEVCLGKVSDPQDVSFAFFSVNPLPLCCHVIVFILYWSLFMLWHPGRVGTVLNRWSEEGALEANAVERCICKCAYWFLSSQSHTIGLRRTGTAWEGWEWSRQSLQPPWTPCFSPQSPNGRVALWTLHLRTSTKFVLTWTCRLPGCETPWRYC